MGRLRCKRCGSTEPIKNGFMRGKQRYRCKACGLNFTATPPPGKPLALKVAAVLLHLSGLSMNRTARLLGVSTPSVMTWIERFAKLYAQKPEPEGSGFGDRAGRDVALPRKKACKLRVWKAWDRASGRLVDGECGGRDAATLERLPARVRQGWKPRLHCTDDRAACAGPIPPGRLHVGKDQTHGIERDHARRRHWPARFRRRTCVVSRAQRMVEASIALFARFGGYDRTSELVSMRT
jgi:insertion element IS1 protein InsB